MAQNGYPEIEDQESTRVEKFLLVILVGFLLMGGFWVFDQIQNMIAQPVLRSDYEMTSMVGEKNRDATSIEEQLAITPLRKKAAKQEEVVRHLNDVVANSEANLRRAESDYKFQREEFRTSIESKGYQHQDPKKFEVARSSFQASQKQTSVAEATLKAAQKDLEGQQHVIDQRAVVAQRIYDQRTSARNLKLFAINFLFALTCLGVTWKAWTRGRQIRWRYQSVLTAGFIAAVLQLFALSFRYLWEIFLADLAVLGISVIGTVVSVLAIVGIKRWLFSPERVAQARLSNRRCQSCATPFTDSQTHCWQCGNRLVETCDSCGSNRLIFAPFCGTCGRPNQVP